MKYAVDIKLHTGEELTVYLTISGIDELLKTARKLESQSNE